MRNPEIGDYVKPDEWKYGENLKEDNGFKDSSFPGCMFRLPSCGGDLAVNIIVTGKVPDRNGMYRCRVEFVQDDNEPPIISGGKIAFTKYHGSSF